MGYESYETALNSSLADIDPQMVLGVFVYKDDAHEVDVEYSAWGDATQNAFRQFVVQPYHLENHMHSMLNSIDDDSSTYTINWLADSIHCQAHSGNEGDIAGDIESSETSTWDFSGDPVAVDNPHMHINLWLFQGQAPQTQQNFEVVISSFQFTKESDIPVTEPEPEIVEAQAFIHWHLEDGSGTSAIDSGALQLDATLSAATWKNDASHNNYIYFDGVQDALVVSDAPGLDQVSDHSYALWLRNDRPNKDLYQRLLSKKWCFKY